MLCRMESILLSFRSNVWLVSFVVTVISNTRHVRNPCCNGLNPVHKRVAILRETNSQWWPVWIFPYRIISIEITVPDRYKEKDLDITLKPFRDNETNRKEGSQKHFYSRPVEFPDNPKLRQNCSQHVQIANVINEHSKDPFTWQEILGTVPIMSRVPKNGSAQHG